MKTLIEQHITLHGGSDEENADLRNKIQQAATISIMQRIRTEIGKEHHEKYSEITKSGDIEQIKTFIQEKLPTYQQIFKEETLKVIGHFRTNPVLA